MDYSSEQKLRGLLTVVGDLSHYGHGNAAYQAKKLCNELVVGIHSDVECKANKRSPIMEETERYKLLGAFRYVHSIIEGIQWNMTCKNLDEYECDFGLHGDDLSLNTDGVDSYDEVRKANRFKEFQRTKNISTSDIIERIWNINKDVPLPHSTDISLIDSYKDLLHLKKMDVFVDAICTTLTCYSYKNCFKHDFNNRSLNEDVNAGKLVFTSGAFDIFNECHLELLKEASNVGSILIVNVISDEEAEKYGYGSKTILSLPERVLMLLHIKYVSLVVVGSLLKYDKELATYFNAEFYPGEYQYNGQVKKFKEKREKIINKILLMHQ